MKRIKANIVDITLPKKSAFMIETEKDFPKLHTLTIMNGRRGGGKTVALVNYLKTLKAKQYIQQVYVITPTYASNKEIWNIAGIQEEDIIEPTKMSVKQIINKGQGLVDEYNYYLENKRIYKKYKNETRPIFDIPDREMMEYYESDVMDMTVEPKWKFKLDVPPRIAFVLDDCLNSEAMRLPSAGLVNLCIRHRHLYDGLGVSIFMLVQTYSALGGVPRPIRENTTNLFLFKISDENQKKKIKQECDLEITDEEFEELLNEAHKEKYNFLLIDFSADCPTKQFRSGFNNYLVLKSKEGLCTCKK